MRDMALKLIGLMLILTPFFLMTYVMVRDSGWRVAIEAWGFTAVIFAVVTLGAFLVVR